MNSNGNKLCDDESTNISITAIIGKIGIVVKPIFQLDKLLNNFKPKPLKNNRPKLHMEIPVMLPPVPAHIDPLVK